MQLHLDIEVSIPRCRGQRGRARGDLAGSSRKMTYACCSTRPATVACTPRSPQRRSPAPSSRARLARAADSQCLRPYAVEQPIPAGQVIGTAARPRAKSTSLMCVLAADAGTYASYRSLGAAGSRVGVAERPRQTSGRSSVSVSRTGPPRRRTAYRPGPPRRRRCAPRRRARRRRSNRGTTRPDRCSPGRSRPP
jgi:hypothetical protein